MSPITTILDVFERQATRLAERAAFAVKRNGRYVGTSWKDAARRVDALSVGLVDLGLRPGHTVALLSNNRPEFIIADLAALAAGAITVPIYPSSTPEQIGHITRHCQATCFIAENPEYLARLIEVKSSLPMLRLVILMEAGPVQAPWRVFGFLEVIHHGLDASPEIRRIRDRARSRLTPDDLATIIYTSGTTGEPKGAMITHGNILFACCAVREAEPEHGDDLVHLSILPLAHALERMAGEFYAIYRGTRVAYAENMETVSENLCEVEPTHVVGVPKFFEKAYNQIVERVKASSPFRQRLFHRAIEIGRRVYRAKLSGYQIGIWLRLQRLLAEILVYRKIKRGFGGRAQFGISGGAPLAPEIVEFFNSIGLQLLEGYGATETCGPVTMNPPDRPRAGTVGIPLPGVELKLADDGEILIKSGGVFAGYYNDPASTAEALCDGWHHTGDIGRFDEQGYLMITDRKKDLIITSAGKNIAPQEIENRLKASLFIGEALIFGDRRNYLTALLTLNVASLLSHAEREGRPVDPLLPLAQLDWVQALIEGEIQKVNQHLASYQQVRRFRILDQDFSEALGELTPTLKVRRGVIATRYAQLIEDMYQKEPVQRLIHREAGVID